MEKHLPQPASTPARRGWSPVRVTLACLLAIAAVITLAPRCPHLHLKSEVGKVQAHCPAQPAPLHPPSTIQWDDESRAESIELFRAAVRIPTQSYDDNGEPGEDVRWAPFYDFIDWLQDAFPVAWKAANVELINTLGIVATFQGSDTSLKPLLLMAHYDVVPVPNNTYDRWTHGPFSADLADGWVFGRGSADDKSLLVSQWEAITHLLNSGYTPRRTVIITHGFDEEEVHARRGQGQIAPFLEKRYGANGLLMVVDEGSGVGDLFGGHFALPGTGEKGYLDIVMRVGTEGGHSSVAPPHTGIGIMSQIINALEADPFKTKLTPDSPLLQGLACVAQAPDAPKEWKKLLKSSKGWAKLAAGFAKVGAMQRALVSTTTAVDVVRGGVKVNALPELVEAYVNFRIDFSESLKSTKDHVERIAAKIAKKHDLEFRAWSGEANPASGRFVTLEVFGAPLEPAPNTPTSGGVWDLFAGTVRAAMGEDLVIAPFATTGNTDCKMYYNLTKHVYRFMGASMDSMANIHTVDERFEAAEHHRTVDWIHALIQNADSYNGPQ
ncbi:hypothetical protein CcaverHIS002_0208320 [Cutaneotrichosporon cavernicola]|uniref:Peptidase M20 dimerisation domain-containing protein n=1 Tax=Cutaneotrichosporon cavernicola TaxID=279322 RepID=A0AA48I1M8_9TREE|nr:uncharacterized protein CcaverHIS019_0208330 [Cutaneotrichosporon cavernicola]BEI81672.1 hypothetical protein CcaverHIS002_0208320 [Cutaneotrichosporon cavernicola]BEI89471.1 hypothetical protein CcaverHIS019_0208330 [Cutaneotrichosporon cavernicola]BEI97244.1 hypothetical protein CcaverHIS631_0208330 [Cutaneotrichosporon cavernicola]BEJ05018.1 hypothetical protein CcaverHIS641_0208350 [Cutaneotrichosporon cavernicola]